MGRKARADSSSESEDEGRRNKDKKKKEEKKGFRGSVVARQKKIEVQTEHRLAAKVQVEHNCETKFVKVSPQMLAKAKDKIRGRKI
mmetsp:Transcript_36280/g.84400  ORF Transcript_36280/g.84400 Transcript_36280/m.84400 type:complete len:86 (-) Transcript_36280:79-336(-)